MSREHKRCSAIAARATIFAALVILTVTRPALSQDSNTVAERQLWTAAQQCSKNALRRYALSSTDPAEKVAEAAFDKCKDLWLVPAEIEGRIGDASADHRKAQENCERLRGSSCPPALPYSYYLMEAAQRQFVHDATTRVFDIRAEAADKEHRDQKP